MSKFEIIGRFHKDVFNVDKVVFKRVSLSRLLRFKLGPNCLMSLFLICNCSSIGKFIIDVLIVNVLIPDKYRFTRFSSPEAKLKSSNGPTYRDLISGSLNCLVSKFFNFVSTKNTKVKLSAPFLKSILSSGLPERSMLCRLFVLHPVKFNDVMDVFLMYNLVRAGNEWQTFKLFIGVLLIDK